MNKKVSKKENQEEENKNGEIPSSDEENSENSNLSQKE